MYLSY